MRLQREGLKWVTPAFIIQSAPFEGIEKRVGYITTRKLGSAVVRNKARRRLKEVIRSIFPNHALPGYDYVIIARSSCINDDFLSLQQDMIWSLGHVHRLQKQNLKQKSEKNDDVET